MLNLQTQPALLISDMQNGFCHPQGTFGKLGLPIQHNRDIIPTINALRAAAHAARILVIYTALGFAPDYSDSGILLDDQPVIKELKGFIRDTWDAEILSDLAPNSSEGEIVIHKTRNTSFWNTNLQEILEHHNINQLLVAGVGTNVCVESTVREAFTRGIRTKTISDATATLSKEEHEASLRSLHWFGGVVTSEEVIEALGKRRQ